MKYYLILFLANAYGGVSQTTHLATIPEPYADEAACHDAAKFEGFKHICVPAPAEYAVRSHCDPAVGK